MFFLLAILCAFALIFFIVKNYLNAHTVEIFKQDLNERAQTLLPTITPLLNAKDAQQVNLLVNQISKTLDDRITIISPSGQVIADSQNDERDMADHFNRPEVQAVLQGAGFGQDIRKSATTTKQMLYWAVPIKSNNKLIGVLRLSVPINTLNAFNKNTLMHILSAGIIIILLCIVLAYFVSKSFTKDIANLTEIVSQISKGNFKIKAQAHSNDEIAQFAKSINKMGDDLEKLFLQTQELDNLKKDFISNASHELKTPITAIVGFSEMLETQGLPQETKHYIDIIKKQSKRLSNIVADLLSLSDLENASSKEIKKNNIYFEQILDDIISLYQKRAQAKNIQIQKEISPNIKTIYANEFYIEQALINLIDNAIKYTEKGMIKIQVHNTQNFTEINIIDTGIGIAPKHLPRLFDRFYVADKSRSRESGGTGLGLAIVKHILLLHNGTIEVQSALSIGSTFTIKFPLN
jgi:signal transduction histidine kinase